jgi:hypothetical protein
MKFVGQALKAFFAAATAALSGLAAVLVGNASIHDVTTAQWVTIALATLISFGAVFGVTNAPAKP